MKESHTIPRVVQNPENGPTPRTPVPPSPEQMLREKYTRGAEATGLTVSERRVLAEAVKERAAPGPSRTGEHQVALWQVVAGTAGIVGVLSLLIWVVWTTAHQWVMIGPVQKFGARDPARVTFEYTAANQMGSRPMGVAYVVAPQGNPIQALAGECRYDGTVVEWKPGLRIFVCPTDGSVYAEDGTYQFGGRIGRSLRQLKTRMEGDRVWMFVPRQRPIPMRDQPSADMPGYM